MRRSGLLRFVAIRAAAAVVLLLITSFIVFSFEFLAPGSPEMMLLGGRPATAELLQSIRAEYHLNDPFFTQYWNWLSGMVHLDFGQSITMKSPVASLLWSRMLLTIELGLYAALIVFVFGILTGMLSALRRDTTVDVGVSSVTLILSSISSYIAAIILLIVFSVDLGWFPIIGSGSGVGGRAYHLTLPAIALALGLVALIARTTRASMSAAIAEEFVEAARARGFRERRVVMKHAFRSGLVPVLTVSGLALGYLITGAVLVEYTFGLNGLGSLLVNSVETKDFAVVQAVALLFTATFILLNFIVDVLYAVVDPRVRLG
jgi:peptide/nickel transport system permease protein